MEVWVPGAWGAPRAGLGCGGHMFPYLGEPLYEVVDIVPTWQSPQSDGRFPAPALWGP